MAAFVKNNPDVRIAFRNYPLPQHKHAEEAAKAAEAADKQGKFWEMHDYIYAHQDELEKPEFQDAKFGTWAKEIGLNWNQFASAIGSDGVIDRLVRDKADGTVCGVDLTPSFFFVSPTQVWRFKGIDDFAIALKDRTHEMWK
jgi:protein-disulfide isomerase